MSGNLSSLLFMNAGAVAGNFPTVESTSNGQSAAGTASAVNLPSGVVAGNLILVLVQLTSSQTISSTPTGFTALMAPELWSGSVRTAIYYKVADGLEGSTLVISTGTSAVRNYACYRISGYQGVPEIAVTATGSSPTADPPSLTPSWGSADTLWIVMATHPASFSFNPSNYTNPIPVGTTLGGSTRTVRRNATAASEDPGVFVSPISFTWHATTLAVRPD